MTQLFFLPSFLLSHYGSMLQKVGMYWKDDFKYASSNDLNKAVHSFENSLERDDYGSWTGKFYAPKEVGNMIILSLGILTMGSVSAFPQDFN